MKELFPALPESIIEQSASSLLSSQSVLPLHLVNKKGERVVNSMIVFKVIVCQAINLLYISIHCPLLQLNSESRQLTKENLNLNLLFFKNLNNGYFNNFSCQRLPRLSFKFSWLQLTVSLYKDQCPKPRKTTILEIFIHNYQR